MMIDLPCPICHGTEFVHDGDRHTETRGDRCPNPECREGRVPARTGETPQTSAGPGTDAMLNPAPPSGDGAVEEYLSSAGFIAYNDGTWALKKPYQPAPPSAKGYTFVRLALDTYNVLSAAPPAAGRQDQGARPGAGAEGLGRDPGGSGHSRAEPSGLGPEAECPSRGPAPPGVLWSAWSETDADSNPSDPGVTYCTEWFIGRWPIGAEEPDCRVLIGTSRSAEIIARRVAEKLTSILNTDRIRSAPSGWRTDCFRTRMSEFDAAYKKARESSQPQDWMEAALLAQQFRNVAYAVLTGEAPKQEPPASVGWVLVPRELDDAMVQAGGSMLPPTHRLTDCYDYFREAWTAALDARPIPPASCDGSGEAGETGGLDPKGNSAVGRQVETPESPQPAQSGAPCSWVGGNDVIWCATCGAEYAYAKGEERPPCPRAEPQQPARAEAGAGEITRTGLDREAIARRAAEASCRSSHGGCACTWMGWDGASALCKQRLDAARLALAQAPALRGGDEGWEPIETAPRDGTIIFVAVWTDIYGWVRGTSRWEGSGFISGWVSRGLSDPPGTLGLGSPTHWRPLPAPPPASPTAGEGDRTC